MSVRERERDNELKLAALRADTEARGAFEERAAREERLMTRLGVGLGVVVVAGGIGATAFLARRKRGT